MSLLYAGSQAALLDSFYGTERGLSARSEVRAEISELITQLEAKNPTASPSEVHTSRTASSDALYIAAALAFYLFVLPV